MSGETLRMIMMCTGYGICNVLDGWMVMLRDNMRKWVLAVKEMNSGIVYRW